MPLYTSISTMPSNIIPFQFSNFKPQNNIVLHQTQNFFPYKSLKNERILSLNEKSPPILKIRARSYNNGNLFAEESMEDDDGDYGQMVEDEEEEEEEGSPWEGAVIYRRNAAVSHIEYCTTLERLGLGKLSTNVSKCRALELGLRVMKGVKDYPDGTPVLVSIDVTRKKKQKLILDGIVKTVLALDCNRCGESAAKNIFENFSLLLTEESFEEPGTINMGVIYGEEKFRKFGNDGWEEEDDDLVDFDDQLYFPPEDKEVDISKHIRDLLHVEITIDAVCGPKCKGMCLRCGTNLNRNSCKCKMQSTDGKQYGPLGNLRKQMQQS